MSNIRLWILILTLTAFTAGIGAGMTLERRRAQDSDWGPLADYERLLIEQFDLSPARAAHLRVILQDYEQKLESVKSRHLSEYTSRMEPELRAHSERYNQFIRDYVLPESSRQRFDDLQGELGLPR